MHKKTKIVCTVGPSTDQPDVLNNMLAAGMNVARFNFSHGNHADHAKRIAMVRAAAAKLGKPVALMLDTKGPEMRLGNFADGKVELLQGQTFTLTSRDVVGTNEIVSVNHKGLPDEVAPGNIILLSDGLVSLEVIAVKNCDIVTTVRNSGVISNYKRVAAPGVSVNLPPLSEQDVADILFGVSENMDFIAASFVQRAADILSIRRVLEDAKAQMDIIAKIENAEGVKNIDEILTVADGLMVARGDLGVEIPTEEVPLVQKMLIKKANQAGKPVITATQMLESMITNPRPTRAEASDVANAIMDGSDAIMLSGETASGAYPVETVETMARIAVKTESALNYREILTAKAGCIERTTTDAISHATVQIAHDLGAAAIITSTESGHTGRMVSKYRPQAVIVAVTSKEKTVRRLCLQWGVHPTLGPSFASTDELFSNAISSALSTGLVKEGDLVVITAGLPVGTSGTTNLIRVHVVGNVLMNGMGIGKKAVTGTVCVVRSIDDLKSKFRPGDILVISNVDEESAQYASQASAIVAEEAGLTSNAAIIGISYGMPVLVGVDGVTAALTDGIVVTVDAARGLLYQGQINAR
ncbi:pyruvate kinase [Anaerosporomusa subterranea]|uniref:Pyruvate kinase n=1 Tax=Anaerosporomusa subterranea TaxID=1794912 RepID=A0A154BT34_ANASB|nr:pyruvate kinase [Anaerosporomusa subterranea]KYZ76990.1 pyruvate kinase [Anaerosporomusa subterranea]